MRWLFTGSIGLDTIARRHGIEGSLVDLEIFSFEPFSPETARGFLQQIATKNDVTLTEEAVSVLCERLGWLAPYYLRKIAKRPVTARRRSLQNAVRRLEGWGPTRGRPLRKTVP